MSDETAGHGVVLTHESKYPDQHADGIGLGALEGAYIHGLRIVSQPVPEISPSDHHGCPLQMRQEGDSLEHILNVAMTPVAAFNP